MHSRKSIRAAGGPYWLLYHFLPGYDSFRYPAKWLPLFSLGVAVAIGEVFDRYRWDPIRPRWFMITGAVIVVALLAVTAVRFHPAWIADRVDLTRKDEFWGPINLDRGLAQVQWSILHSAIAIYSMLLLTLARFSVPTKMFVLALVVALDLAVAGNGLIAAVPKAREQALITERSLQPLREGSRWMRTQSGDGWPEIWKQTIDPDRLLDVEASLRVSRFGRWHLADRIGMFNNMVSIQSKEIADFWKASKQVTVGMSVEQRDQFWQGIRQSLAIDGVIHQPTSIAETTDGDRVAQLIDQRQMWNPSEGLLRFVADANEETVAAQNRIDFKLRLQSLAAQPVGEPITAVTELDADQTSYSGIQIDTSGLLIRPAFQDGHWQAEYAPTGTDQWTPTPVLKVDRLTQGVVLPAGDWNLRFRYQPAWLLTSLIVAAASWIGLAVWSRQ